MKKTVFLILLLSSLLSLSLYAADFSGLERIVESGKLRILMAKDDWWPFFYVDKDGTLSGIDVELAERICDNLGVEPEFIRKDSFNQLSAALKNGDGDVIISYYSYTPQRNLDIFLTDDYLNSADCLLINNQVLENLKKMVYDVTPENLTTFLNSDEHIISTISYTAQEIWAGELFPEATVILYDQSEISPMLNKREISAFYFDELWLKFFLAQNPEFYLNYTLFKLLKKDNLVIGVSPDNFALYTWLDKFLSSNLDMNLIIEDMYDDYAMGIDSYLQSNDEIKTLIKDPWRYILLFGLFLTAFIFIRTSQNREKKQGKHIHWLLNFYTVIFSMITGLYCGVAFPSLTEYLSPFGDIFFNYLLLCGIPILFCVVLINFVKLMTHMGGLHFFVKFISVILVFFLLGSFIGILTGVTLKPGMSLSNENRQTLARAMNETAESELMNTTEMTPGDMLWSLPKTMITDSLFKSFSENKTLAILFFAILLAFALKQQKAPRRERFIEVVGMLNDLFIYLFKLSYYILPFGLFALMLSQAQLFAEDAAVISAFFLFTVCQFIIVGIWFVISLSIGCINNRMGPAKFIAIIKKPMLILFSLLSTLAAIPAVIEVCEKNEEYNDETIKGTMPLIMVLLIPSVASMFSLTTIFLIQLTGLEISLLQYVFILFGAMGATLATTGVPAPIYLYAMSIVVTPFGIPISQAIFFMLPWTLTAVRLETINFTMLDFGIVHFFKKKKTIDNRKHPKEEQL